MVKFCIAVELQVVQYRYLCGFSMQPVCVCVGGHIPSSVTLYHWGWWFVDVITGHGHCKRGSGQVPNSYCGGRGI